MTFHTPAHKQASTSTPVKFPSKASIRKAQRELMKLSLKDLVETHDLQFVHIRNANVELYPSHAEMETNPKGGTTLAYKVVNGRGNVIELATAICNPKDLYDKIVGKHWAATNFADGQTIKIRLAQGTRWGQQIKFMFESVT